MVTSLLVYVSVKSELYANNLGLCQRRLLTPSKPKAMAAESDEGFSEGKNETMRLLLVLFLHPCPRWQLEIVMDPC